MMDNKKIKEAIKIVKNAGYPVIYEPTDTYEMTPIRKKYTGLAMNIWIDELEKYKVGKHEIYVKFQTDTDDDIKAMNKVIPMNLNGEIKVKLPRNCSLTDLDIEGLRIYVMNNREALEKIATCKLFYNSIEKYLIKGTKPATKKQKEKLLMKIKENLV